MNVASDLTEAQRQFSEQIDSGRQESAYELALQVYRRNPFDPGGTEFFVSALYRLKRDLGLAATLARDLAVRFPRNIRMCSLAVHCLLAAGRAEDADKLLRASLSEEPDNRLLRLELIFCRLLQGQIDEAQLALKSLAVDHPMPEINFHSAWMELYNGNFAKGFQGIAEGREMTEWGAAAAEWPVPEWDGGREIRGEILFVILEGGFGDFFVTLAAIPALVKRTGARIVAVAPESFYSVARRTSGVESIMNYGQLKSEKNGHWVAGLDLNKLLGPNPVFPLGPFLKATPDIANKWNELLGPFRKKFDSIVGLRFSGEPKHDLNSYRSMTAAEAAELIAKMPAVGFVALYPKHEAVNLPGNPENFLNFNSRIESWEDTLGLIENLDGVVSTCTSAAHAAAAMGVPLIVLSIYWSYHVWTQKSEENFYYGPHVHVLRQKQFRDWAGLFDPAVKEISKWKS